MRAVVAVFLTAVVVGLLAGGPWVAFLIIGTFIAGVIASAMADESDRKLLVAQRDQARRDAAAARYETAAATERAEHLRAEMGWKGGWQ